MPALVLYPMMRDAAAEVLIEHNKLIDGFAELTKHRCYLSFDTFCGICDAAVTVSPRTQKYMLEVKSIPVKMLRRGAVYCVKCRQRRSRINWLKRGDRWRAERNGKEELKDLLSEEQNLKNRSKRLYENAQWPYESKVADIIEQFVSQRMAASRRRCDRDG